MEQTQASQSTDSSRQKWTEVARWVVLSRELDDLEEQELAPSGEIPYQFSAKGHELAQVLLALNLDHPHDAAGVYYRSRPFMLTSGLRLEEALSAGMGRAGGPSDGRDVGVVFSMPARSGPTILPASGDVGAQYTPVAGWAQAISYRSQTLTEQDWQGALAVALGGDGSVASNGFWSALTIATSRQLPMLFFIEDNGYGISVPASRQTPGGNIASNLQSFQNLVVFSGSGTEPEGTRALIQQAIGHVRDHSRPALLRLTVPRISGHTFIDNQAYKSEQERQHEAQRDPLIGLGRLIGQEQLESMRVQAREEIQQALEAARQRPQPQMDPRRYVFFEEGEVQQVGGMAPELGLPRLQFEGVAKEEGPRLNLIDAVRSVLEQELEDNPRALVFGEDVGVKGGVHGATRDLQLAFGAERVFDTSLSEEGIIGRSVGLALAGLLPIPEIQFRKYADPATEQLHDLGTIRWRTAGTFAAPVVVRMPVGYSKKVGDPWHSVTDEASFAHSLGWRVAFPSNAADAAGLLRTALRGQDPTVFFEHRALLDSSQGRRPDPGPDYMLPFGRAAQLTVGDRLTVVTWGAMVPSVMTVAREFEGDLDVLDLRTIVPWDRRAVLASLKKTGRCLVVQEDIGTAGFGAEIIATIAEEAFTWLDAPLTRLAAPDSLVPYSRNLIDEVIPSEDRIRRTIEELLAF
jgi:2-oxoisovalerate dehydrogenase E1 component